MSSPAQRGTDPVRSLFEPRTDKYGIEPDAMKRREVRSSGVNIQGRFFDGVYTDFAKRKKYSR